MTAPVNCGVPSLTVINHGPGRDEGDVEVVPYGVNQWTVQQYVMDPATGRLDVRRITNGDAPDDKITQHSYKVWGSMQDAIFYAKKYVAGLTDGQIYRKALKTHAEEGAIFIGNYKEQ